MKRIIQVSLREVLPNAAEGDAAIFLKRLLRCVLRTSLAMTLLLLPSLVWADAVTFEATVDSPRISLDQVMQLTLTFTGINNDISPVSLPVLDGFSAKYLGPATSVTIINGDYHSERSFIYELFPNRAGHFQIPPISAAIGGQTYTTKPIDVEVFPTTSQAQAASSQSAGQNQVPSQESLKDKILVQASVGKTDVYLDEQIPMTVKLLVTAVPVRDVQYPQFDQQGFTADDFGKPDQDSQVINGVSYDTVEFKTDIYPTRLGDVTVGPVQMAGNVLYKTGENNPFQDNDFFGAADMFNGFFDSYATRPVTVAAKPIVLHVSPLPDADRPDDFSGAVGQFDFHAGVSPLQVKAGDPLTLKIDVQGNGNFKNMKMPVFQAGGFKAYPPQIKDLGNEKTSEQVIIPTSTDIKEVPALRFSYFDPLLKDYKTVTQGPFAIQVTAPNPDQEFKAIGFTDLNKGTASLPANQSFWGKALRDIFQICKKLCASIWFWVSLSVVLAAGIVYWSWRRFQERLLNDPAFARRLKAYRGARQTLAQANAEITAVRTKEFYASLSKALHDYLADKWHQSSAALGTNEILARLERSQLDQTHLAQVKGILEKSDLARFAGASFDSSKMRADLAQTQDLIDRLEKILK